MSRISRISNKHYQIDHPFNNHGPDQGVNRDFLSLPQGDTPGHLTQPWQGIIGKVSYHQ